MQTRFVFRGVDPELREESRQRWAELEQRLDKLLRRFPEDQRRLSITLESQKRGFEAQAVLALPTGTLVAHGHGERNLDALDDLADRVWKEARRHKERLHGDAASERKRRRQREFADVTAFLEEHHRQGRSEAFFEVLRPLLGNLRELAAHELVMAQLEGKLAPGECTVAGILDDVLIRAWERFDTHLPAQYLERWLVTLLHEVVDERVEETGEAELLSLETEPADELARYRAREDFDADQEFWFWPQRDQLHLEDLIPDEAMEASVELNEEEERKWILDQLRTLPRIQRRAFTLVGLEGWDPAEVALAQGREIEDVETDVREVRAMLERRATAPVA